MCPNVPFFGANFGRTEIPGHISFYESGSKKSAKFNAGIKILVDGVEGKMVSVLFHFARGKYGDSNFKHKFFDNLEYNDFQSFVIKTLGKIG